MKFLKNIASFGPAMISCGLCVLLDSKHLERAGADRSLHRRCTDVGACYSLVWTRSKPHSSDARRSMEPIPS